MALSAYALPFGLRHVQITPIDDAGVLVTASKVSLPAARTFTFTETEDFSELRGNDVVVASHGAGPVVEWDLEGGGISLEVWKALGGGTLVSSGVTPAAKKTLTKLTTSARPYFQIEGQAISDSGGDVHGIVYRCKADGDLEAEFANGEFMLTSASGKGYGNLTDFKLYEWVHNETPIGIV
jgi:hypothetical protein